MTSAKIWPKMTPALLSHQVDVNRNVHAHMDRICIHSMSTLDFKKKMKSIIFFLIQQQKIISPAIHCILYQ